MAVLTPTPAIIKEAARHIRAGGLVGMPTETVYGLAADATNGEAIASIYELKARPAFNPLIIHVLNLGEAERLAQFSTIARILAKRMWPGPLTLILPVKPGCAIHPLARAGLETVALRIPDHPVALQLLDAVGKPVAAPSANRSGRLSPTRADHVETSFRRSLGMILDGGPSRIGLESTILDMTGAAPLVLRPGGLSAELLAATLGTLYVQDNVEKIISPGQMASHYAPFLTLRLNAEGAPQRSNEALLAFGATVPKNYAATLNLSTSGNLREAAANFFDYLYRLDRPDYQGIAVMPIPEHGLGLAINDRLRRAATAPSG